MLIYALAMSVYMCVFHLWWLSSDIALIDELVLTNQITWPPKYRSTRWTSIMLTLQREKVTVVVNTFFRTINRPFLLGSVMHAAESIGNGLAACLPPHQSSLCTRCHHCTLLDSALCTVHIHNLIHIQRPKWEGDCVFGCFLKSRDQVACDALMMAACFYLLLLLSPFLNYIILW
jgi:hypothetical protein